MYAYHLEIYFTLNMESRLASFHWHATSVYTSWGMYQKSYISVKAFCAAVNLSCIYDRFV